mgnify:CR=1 FL=1
MIEELKNLKRCSTANFEITMGHTANLALNLRECLIRQKIAS